MNCLLTRESFHLMVLNLVLPGEEGLSICRLLRSQSNQIPIIMVTAKWEEVDRIVDLEIGTDNYIPKPFPREPPAALPQEKAIIAFGKFKLNRGTLEIFREDEPMPLRRLIRGTQSVGQLSTQTVVPR